MMVQITIRGHFIIVFLVIKVFDKTIIILKCRQKREK